MKEVDIEIFSFIRATNPLNYMNFAKTGDDAVLLVFLQLRYIFEVTSFRRNYDWIPTLDTDYISRPYGETENEFKAILLHCSSLIESADRKVDTLSILKENPDMIKYIYDISVVVFSHFRDKKRAGVEVAEEVMASGIIFNFISGFVVYSPELKALLFAQ